VRRGLPKSLMEWLGSKGYIIRDIKTITIDLGPGGSYWASDKNSTAWCNLPAALDKKIDQSRKPGGGWMPGKRPIMVSLGYDGSYIMITEGRAASWNLRGQNAELDTFLTNAKTFSNIAVSSCCTFPRW
jgi:hypothetical protein